MAGGVSAGGLGAGVKIIDDATLQRLEELHKAASPVPWGVDTDGREVCTFRERLGSMNGKPPFDIMSESFAREGAEHDAALIAESRNALPLLLDSVRRLKEALAIAMPLVKDDADAGLSSTLRRIRELVGE